MLELVDRHVCGACVDRRTGSSPVTRTTSPQESSEKIGYARVVELADSLDSGSSAHYGRAGSSPASRTMTSVLIAFETL